MAFSNKPIEKVLTEISKSGEFSDAKIDTMRFVMRSMVGEIEKIVILLIIFSLLSHQMNFILVSLAMMTIRPTAGGFHSDSALGCLLWPIFAFLFSILCSQS